LRLKSRGRRCSIAGMQYISMLFMFAALFAGVGLHRLGWAPKPRLTDRAMSLSLWLLLFSMGFRLGLDQSVTVHAASIGITAFLFAAAASAGSIGCVFLVYIFIPRDRIAKKDKQVSAKGDRPQHPWRESLWLLLMVVSGGVAGFLLSGRVVFTGERVSTGLLYVLLFIIGIQFSQGGYNPLKLLAHPDTVVIPAATVCWNSCWQRPAIGMYPGESF
jgi:uncharacterized membrane protein YbjE (DUF340 family)